MSVPGSIPTHAHVPPPASAETVANAFCKNGGVEAASACTAPYWGERFCSVVNELPKTLCRALRDGLTPEQIGIPTVADIRKTAEDWSFGKQFWETPELKEYLAPEILATNLCIPDSSFLGLRSTAGLPTDLCNKISAGEKLRNLGIARVEDIEQVAKEFQTGTPYTIPSAKSWCANGKLPADICKAIEANNSPESLGLPDAQSVREMAEQFAKENTFPQTPAYKEYLESVRPRPLSEYGWDIWNSISPYLPSAYTVLSYAGTAALFTALYTGVRGYQIYKEGQRQEQAYQEKVADLDLRPMQLAAQAEGYIIPRLRFAATALISVVYTLKNLAKLFFACSIATVTIGNKSVFGGVKKNLVRTGLSAANIGAGSIAFFVPKIGRHAFNREVAAG